VYPGIAAAREGAEQGWSASTAARHQRGSPAEVGV